MKTISKFLILIIVLGALIRIINLNQPLLEGASTRQINTAMIARNYYTRDFNLFYPQIDGPGRDVTYLMQEFYIIPFIAAIFYKLLGGVYEWVLRLISVFSFILATIMIYKLASYYHNKRIGVISVFCFTISPLCIYLGRAVHPEMLIAFFIMAAIYSFSKWFYENRNIYGFWAILSFTFAVLLKIPNLYLLLPLLYIVFVKHRWNFVKQSKLWIFLIASLVPITLFNYHQHLVRVAFPNSAMDNFSLKAILDYIKVYLPSKEFYKAIYENLISYTLTPIGFAFFIIGAMLKIETKKDLLFHLWILSVLIFFLIMPGQSWQGYYQMHLLPIACIIIGRLIYQFSQSQFYKNYFFGKRISQILFLSITLIVVFRYSYAYYRVPENFRYVVETGKAIDQLTEKDALVIASIENGADLLYYANRKGWRFMIHRDDLEGKELRISERKRIYDRILYLEKLREDGADYFASASMPEFLSHEKFSEYMFKNYKVIKQTPHFIIFDIKNKKDNRR